MAKVKVGDEVVHRGTGWRGVVRMAREDELHVQSACGAWWVVSKRFVAVLLATALCVLSGCFRHEYVFGRGADVSQAPTSYKWRSHWVGGIGGSARTDLAQCTSGNLVARDGVTVANGVAGALTLGVWTPSTVRVWCAP